MPAVALKRTQQRGDRAAPSSRDASQQAPCKPRGAPTGRRGWLAGLALAALPKALAGPLWSQLGRPPHPRQSPGPPPPGRRAETDRNNTKNYKRPQYPFLRSNSRRCQLLMTGVSKRIACAIFLTSNDLLLSLHIANLQDSYCLCVRPEQTPRTAFPFGPSARRSATLSALELWSSAYSSQE